MLVDYHIHTFRCGHAVGTVQDYVAAARKKGFQEFGFSEHLPLYWLPEEQRDRTYALKESELPLYIAEVRAVQAANPDLAIRLGIEADYIPGYEEQLQKHLEALPLDYALGSVHFLEGWAFDDPDRLAEYQNHNIDELYQKYFKTVQRAAATGIFDIMSHPDLIKKFGFKPHLPLQELYLQTVQVFKENNVCVDVNAAGWRYPCAELYPSPEFLRLCLENEVPVTLGSDAHKPELLGEGLDRAASLLRQIGFREVATFCGRKRQLVGL